ncbi:MAG: DUF1643 domain-containing protein [Synechococcales bacterium]|nr:DUF1643 domain-containing protein [Synechococcales bacterium]
MTPSGAVFSACQTYRYALWRVWDDQKPWVLFLGLNPSTADGTRDDPTCRRCIGYAQSWGYGGVYVANLFAYRATHPYDLKAAEYPVGPETDEWIRDLNQRAARVIVAWGNHGSFLGRDRTVFPLLTHPHCLAVTQIGHPAHPLYLKKSLQPSRWRPSWAVEPAPLTEAR